jgi:hypothetical protein
MRTCGGDWSVETVSAIKFALIPIMAMSEMACMPLTTSKVTPRAPSCGRGILEGVGEGLEAEVVLDFALRGVAGLSGAGRGSSVSEAEVIADFTFLSTPGFSEAGGSGLVGWSGSSEAEVGARAG